VPSGRLGDRLDELTAPVEESERVRQEATPLLGEGERSMASLPFPVELRAEALLERQEPAPQALLRDEERPCSTADAALPA